ncbi:MAG: GEVED domain-containing protein [candidate division KSB1 bacterium]|nr:GEVED domain-containing protein [candidate division KSB1 bacterium]
MKSLCLMVAGILTVCSLYAQPTFTGYLYEGPEGSTSRPIEGSTIRLLNVESGSGVLLDTDVTSADGSFSVSISGSTTPKTIRIVQDDLPGHTSIAAQTIGGSVFNSTAVEYTGSQILNGPYHGNNFWDNPPNRAPVADAGGPYHGLVGQSVRLDGSGSYDPDERDYIAQWLWDLDEDGMFGDSDEETFNQTWAAPFEGQVYLRVYDSHDQKDEDSASVIISENWDFGDAPAPYQTTYADNGASHRRGSAVLGSEWDGESSGSPSANGLGDDTNGSDDEDGIHFESMTLYPGQTLTVPFTVKYQPTEGMPPLGGAATVSVYGWMDYNHDGEWDAGVGSEEMICEQSMTVSSALPVYNSSFTFTVPGDVEPGHTYARFRLYVNDADPGGPVDFISSVGHGGEGEVEDYFLNILPARDRDYGDAPDSYPTLEADGGACHFVGALSLGEHIDAEIDGIPSALARGDDDHGIDDEDGVTFSRTFFHRDDEIDVQITIHSEDSSKHCLVQGWVDFNQNNVFDSDMLGYNELVYFSSDVVSAGATATHDFTLEIPEDAEFGRIAARFRLFTGPDASEVVQWNVNSPTGMGGYGEVEDYMLQCSPRQTVQVYDLGDAPEPYPTRWEDEGAAHTVHPFVRLGELIDHEGDGQPHRTAEGDDDSGENDEDGTTLPRMDYYPGGTLELTTQVHSNAPEGTELYYYLIRWIDFDISHTWDEDEMFLTGPFLMTGGDTDTWPRSIPIPEDAEIGHTFMRTRLFVSDSQNTEFDLLPTGYGGDGEVEDYFLVCIDREGTDYGDAPVGYPEAWNPLGGPWLGGASDRPDDDSGMQWNMIAVGDDEDGNDDENGLTGSFLAPGVPSVVFVNITPFQDHDADQVSMQLWIDYNRNGQFDEGMGETVTSRTFSREHFDGIVSQRIPVHFITPGFVTPGPIVARCRISVGNSAMVMMPPYGEGLAGEVEDHILQVHELSMDFGQVAVIGFKFNDLNRDGILSGGDEGLEGWRMYLDANDNARLDPGEASAVTDHRGLFAIIDPDYGHYKLREQLQPGWRQVYPGPIPYYDINIDADDFYAPYIFGNVLTELPGGTDTLKWAQPPLLPLRAPRDWFEGKAISSRFGSHLLADDWYCSNSEPVTGVTWWGAYDNWDETTPPANAPDSFLIAILDHETTTEGEGPANGIYGWLVGRDQFTETLEDSIHVPGSSDDPQSCFKYTYHIPDDADWFYQLGDSNHYWICIAPIYEDIPDANEWGWVSRQHYFHEDAVRITEPVNTAEPVEITEYAPVGTDVDLAFLLHTNRYGVQYDFGDAAGVLYQTLDAHNGAKHLQSPDVYLGEFIDMEKDAGILNNATGDDARGVDDEDGIEEPIVLLTGENFYSWMDVSAAGYLNIWIDCNSDSAWNDGFEHVLQDYEMDAGQDLVAVPVPAVADSGNTMMRVRFSTEPNLPYYGLALDGEVEDYAAVIKPGDTAHLPDTWKSVRNTGYNATIVLPLSAEPRVDDISLATGNYVGVFSSEGICCGYSRWQGENMQITAWGDDPATADVVEGFTAGEDIQYRVLQPETQREIRDVQVTYSQGSGVYQTDALFVIASFNTSSDVTFEKAFSTGWNGFSYNITNDDNRIDTALEGISSHIQIMKDGLGNTWLPEFGINNLGDLNFTKGYKVLMKTEQTIEVNGTPVDSDFLIQLQRGWNMIGYLPQFPAPAAFCFSELGSKLLLAKDMQGNSFIPEFGINTIGELEPGEAYKLSMAESASLRFPLVVTILGKSKSTQTAQPVHFTVKGNTGENASLVIPTSANPVFSDGTALKDGDEIGVFNSDGLCCGASVWEGDNLLITLWGDDGMTSVKDGFYAGDSLYFKVWDHETEYEYRAEAQADSMPIVYRPDQMYVLTGLTGGAGTAVDSRAERPDNFVLRPNFPNPFNPVTRISFETPVRTLVNIKVFNMSGQCVATLMNNVMNAGYHSVEWDAAQQPSGVYLCKMTAEIVFQHSKDAAD